MGNIDKFDFMADRYDTAERMETAKIIADTIRGYVIGGKDKAVVDYGCGTGLVGLRLLDDFKSVLFVDAANNMVEQVRQKLERLEAKNAEALCRDFMAEAPRDIKADYIFLVQVLLHEKDTEVLLTRLYSILSEGGHLLIVDFDKNEGVVSSEVHNGFEQEELAGVLRGISFSSVESKTFYRGRKIFMNQDASLFILDAVK